jgi:hypothetical protein
VDAIKFIIEDLNKLPLNYLARLDGWKIEHESLVPYAALAGAKKTLDLLIGLGEEPDFSSKVFSDENPLKNALLSNDPDTLSLILDYVSQDELQKFNYSGIVPHTFGNLRFQRDYNYLIVALREITNMYRYDDYWAALYRSRLTGQIELMLEAGFNVKQNRAILYAPNKAVLGLMLNHLEGNINDIDERYEPLPLPASLYAIAKGSRQLEILKLFSESGLNLCKPSAQGDDLLALLIEREYFLAGDADKTSKNYKREISIYKYLDEKCR